MDWIKVEQIDVVLDNMAVMPTKAHDADAGFDLYMPIGTVGICRPMDSMEVDTGVHMLIPKGYCGIIMSKSGLNIKYGLTSTGLIDAGYTGSIRVKLYNYGNKNVTFKGGDKLTQIVILPIPEVELMQVESLPETERGENGFGSSGR